MRPKKYYRDRSRREMVGTQRPKSSLGVLAWIKDWSGVLTALIAILYTFPFDAVSKINEFWDKDIIEARAALSKIAELNAEKILSSSKIQNADIRTSAFLANTFDIRIYNIIVKEKDVFSKVTDRLSASELYTAGSSLVLSGFIKESFPLYEASIKKSSRDNVSVYVAALREYGLANVTKSNLIDIKKAREEYISAMRVIADKQNGLDPFTYAVDYAEISISELMYGDWACGSSHIVNALLTFEKLKRSSLQNANAVNSVEEYFRTTAARKSKLPGQSEKGCDYEIPPIEISQ